MANFIQQMDDILVQERAAGMRGIKLCPYPESRNQNSTENQERIARAFVRAHEHFKNKTPELRKTNIPL